MTAASDALRDSKRLEGLGLNEEQADGVVDMMRETHKLDQERVQLATRGDLNEIELKLAKTKAEIIKWVIGAAAGQVGLIFALLKMFPGTHP